MSLTTQEKIYVGYTCSILASNEIAGGKKQGGLIDLRLPDLLHAVTYGLEQLYTLDPTSEDIEPIGNYLIGMCKHQARAEAKLALSTGGTTSIINPNGLSPYQFEVDSTSFIATGDTVKQFLSTWIGVDILFIRNSVPQGTVVSASETYYSWDSTTALLTLFGPAPGNGAAFETEKFQIFPI